MSNLPRQNNMPTYGGKLELDAVVVNNVSKSFGTRRALTDVSFTVSRGELFGVVGPDGAGKTTLFNVVSGILKPSGGSVAIASQNRPRVGYVTQSSSMVDELTVTENVIYSAMLQGIDRRSAADKSKSLLDEIGLRSFHNRLAGQLSGGMKQKLALCCALVSRPDILLLDEPSTGLDPIARRELWQRFTAIAESGVPIVIGTPDFDEAEMCTRIAFLHTGKILKIGTAEDLRGAVPVKRLVLHSPDLDRVDQLLHSIHEQRSPVLDVVRFGDRIDVLTEQTADEQWLKNLLSANDLGNVSVTSSSPRLENAYSTLSAGTVPLPMPEIRSATPWQSVGALIKIENVSKSFADFQSVKNLNLHIEQGEVFGLLGANGAGKTTTLRMLCGLIRPTRGQFTVFGFSPYEHNKRMRSMVGYVNQQFALYDDLTVEENISYTARTFRLSGTTLRENVDWAIRALALEDVRLEPARVLSRGVKQRVALAAAISHRPRALLLDEPTAGTDPEARRRIWRLIRILTKEGATILVTTHYLEEAEFCNRVGLLVDGTLIACDTPENIKATTSGLVLEVHCVELDEAMRIASKLVPATNALRLPDRLRIIVADERAEHSLRKALSEARELSINRVDMSLEEAFIVRSRQARGAVPV
jgi:ABC-2 type transport system ATP-binding protein